MNFMDRMGWIYLIRGVVWEFGLLQSGAGDFFIFCFIGSQCEIGDLLHTHPIQVHVACRSFDRINGMNLDNES